MKSENSKKAEFLFSLIFIGEIMTRKEEREQAFTLIFESLFGNEKSDLTQLYSENVEEISDYALMLFNGVNEKEEELDSVISKYSKGWKISRISKVNVAILRLAVYELKYVDEVPQSVSINEAVELAKKYSSKEDSAFINGLLGSVVRED